jgi:hypothetical protein
MEWLLAAVGHLLTSVHAAKALAETVGLVDILMRFSLHLETSAIQRRMRGRQNEIHDECQSRENVKALLKEVLALFRASA